MTGSQILYPNCVNRYFFHYYIKQPMTCVLEKWLSEVYIGLKGFFCRRLHFVKGKYGCATLLKKDSCTVIFTKIC